MGIMLFLVPALVIYLVFQIIPIIGSIYFSLVDWNGIAGSAPKFVGLKNYIDAFHNADFILSLKNMARMVIISVICHTPIALLMAVAINTKCKGYRIFKALFFVPTVFPLTAVGLMWYFIFMPTGSFNSLLEVIGLSDLVMPWLVDPSTAMNTIVFVNVWAGVGYYMVIIAPKKANRTIFAPMSPSGMLLGNVYSDGYHRICQSIRSCICHDRRRTERSDQPSDNIDVQ